MALCMWGVSLQPSIAPLVKKKENATVIYLSCKLTVN